MNPVPGPNEDRVAGPKSVIGDLEVRKRIQQMKEAELIDFIRETVTQLDALADRLEAQVGKPPGKPPTNEEH